MGGQGEDNQEGQGQQQGVYQAFHDDGALFSGAKFRFPSYNP
jgi:hypothetical protein